MAQIHRRIVRYRNRKLYEATERRFVTIQDLARTVAAGGHVEVRAADTGEDITAKILSRALASEGAAVPASTDALTRLLRAGSDAAETVADVVEKVGGTRVAATVRRAATPERLAETFGPLTRRLEDARQDVERIVGGLVGRGRLTWEEGTRLKEDFGAVFQKSLSDVIRRVRELTTRLAPDAAPEITREIQELKARLDQLEELAASSFSKRPAASGPENKSQNRGRRASASRRRKS